jgi:hypothetical protein
MPLVTTEKEMKRPYIEDTEKIARNELIRQQARRDPICAEYLALQATNAKAGNGFSFIETQLDAEEDDDDFRPF